MATEYKNSDNEYHRIDGPALIEDNGTKHWFLNGRHHRINGPAIIWPNGSCIWMFNNMIHNPNGPAVQWSHVQKWYILNIKHRLYHPSVIYKNGEHQWYIGGILCESEKSRIDETYRWIMGNYSNHEKIERLIELEYHIKNEIFKDKNPEFYLF